jgi:prevent-host-death family protein
MPSTVTLEEAKAHLEELVEQLLPGDEIVITHENRPVARLVPTAEDKPRPRFGSCKGMLTIVSDDEHLEHFKEYMP